MEGYSVDYLNLRTGFLFELALANPDDNAAVRDVKMVKRFRNAILFPALAAETV